MGSFNSRYAFDPLDLEIIDKVYEAAMRLYCSAEPLRSQAECRGRGRPSTGNIRSSG
jgi:hypothetical protein